MLYHKSTHGISELTSSCFLLFEGVSCEPGEIVFGCVLDWNLNKKLVVVSLTPELVAERKAVEAHKGKQKKVKVLKIVLTKWGNVKVEDTCCVRSYTAVTCFVAQHSLQVSLMLHEGFNGLANLSGFCLVAAEKWTNH